MYGFLNKSVNLQTIDSSTNKLSVGALALLGNLYYDVRKTVKYYVR